MMRLRQRRVCKQQYTVSVSNRYRVEKKKKCFFRLARPITESFVMQVLHNEETSSGVDTAVTKPLHFFPLKPYRTVFFSFRILKFHFVVCGKDVRYTWCYCAVYENDEITVEQRHCYFVLKFHRNKSTVRK